MASEHDNDVTVTASDFIAVKYGGYFKITDGQPSSPPPSISNSGSDWNITMKCGERLG